MPDMLHVWPEAPIVSGDTITRRAIIEFPANGREILWYRIPLSWEHALTESSDPFAKATVFVAMRLGADLNIHGTVSPSLLRNLDEFQRVWHCWKPHLYKPGQFIADCECEALVSPNHYALACFSGGVDSCFTTYRHAKGLCGRQRENVKSGINIHWTGAGPCVAASQPARRAAAMLGSLGISLITMETNWRELWHSLSLPWLDCHGAAYLACASMLQAEFRIVLLASTYSYGTVCPYGSTPIGDVLLSSNAQQVRHDGAGFSRVEKVALIGQWPEAMRNLHVCWEGSDGDLNCGVCEKCIRTILDFRVNGLPLPSAFASDVSDDLIASVPIRTDVQLNEFESILDRAIENGLAQESWVRTLEKRLQRAQWGPSPWAVARSRLQLRARVRRLRSLVWRQKER